MSKRSSIFEKAFVNMLYDLLSVEKGIHHPHFLNQWAEKFNAASQTHVMVVKYSDQDDRWFVIERLDKERLLTVYTHSVSAQLSVDFSPVMLVQELNDICDILTQPLESVSEVQS